MERGDLVVVAAEQAEEPPSDPVAGLRAMAERRRERARRARGLAGVIEVALVTPDGRAERSSWPGVG